MDQRLGINMLSMIDVIHIWIWPVAYVIHDVHKVRFRIHQSKVISLLRRNIYQTKKLKHLSNEKINRTVCYE